MSSVPSELSLSQLAEVLDIPRHVVRYRADRGTIPTRRPCGGKGKRVVPMSVVRRDFPDLWDAILLKAETLGDYPDDDGRVDEED